MGRSAAILAAAAGVAVLAAWLLWLAFGPSGPQLPAGDSTSYQPDGAQGLFQWAQASGLATRRLYDRSAPLPAGATVLLLDPQLPFAPAGDDRYVALLRSGGTLVIAGGAFTQRPLARELGVVVEPSATQTRAQSVTTGGSFAVTAHSRLRPAGARAPADGPPEPLLTTPDGDWLAARQRLRGGTVVVLSTSYPLSNEALHDPQAATFVYREILVPAAGHELVFDHSHYVPRSAEEGAQATLGQLLVGHSWGRALYYAAAVVFLYLLLAGQRFGPPLPPLRAAAAERTMFEQVQAVGGLFHRSGQLGFARQHFSRYYGRRLDSRGGPGDSEAAQVVSRIEGAGSPAALLAAVRQAEQQLQARSWDRAARSGTLSAR